MLFQLLSSKSDQNKTGLSCLKMLYIFININIIAIEVSSTKIKILQKENQIKMEMPLNSTLKKIKSIIYLKFRLKVKVNQLIISINVLIKLKSILIKNTKANLEKIRQQKLIQQEKNLKTLIT